jgi:ABC-type polysaccharide/polyol phosphate export permease
LGWVVDINPVKLYLSVIRDPLLGGIPSSEGLVQLSYAYFAAVVFTGVLVGLAAGVVSWLQKKVIFYL